MARRSVWVQMQREAERRRREAERAARALERERQQRAKEAARQRAYDEKEQKRLYVEQRTQEVEHLTQEIRERVEQLQGLLKTSLSIDTSFEIDTLKEQPATIPFEPGQLAVPVEPPTKHLPVSLSGLQKLLPGAKAKHEQLVTEAETRYAAELAQAVQVERDRQTALAAAARSHEALVQAEAEQVANQNKEVSEFKASYEARDTDSIATYCSMVLARSRYPEGFPQQHKVAYVPESQQLVIEMDLPTFDVVPNVARVSLRQDQR